MLEKQQNLINHLKELGSIAVAFSGGVDSTYLLKMAKDTLKDRVIAVTIQAAWVPVRELEEAKAFCEKEGILHVICEADTSEIPGFTENPPERCYLCKKAIFQKILAIAKEHGVEAVAEGSNVDDLGDYRPGLKAIEELGIKSPLREAGLTKEDIRKYSHELELPTWKKPSYACLASRFVYGETITPEKLAMIEQAEQCLLDLGFEQMRVRLHGTLARIEVPKEDIPKIMEEKIRQRISKRLLDLGFSYVTIDMIGFRSGSMNEILANK